MNSHLANVPGYQPTAFTASKNRSHRYFNEHAIQLFSMVYESPFFYFVNINILSPLYIVTTELDVEVILLMGIKQCGMASICG